MTSLTERLPQEEWQVLIQRVDLRWWVEHQPRMATQLPHLHLLSMRRRPQLRCSLSMQRLRRQCMQRQSSQCMQRQSSRFMQHQPRMECPTAVEDTEEVMVEDTVEDTAQDMAVVPSVRFCLTSVMEITMGVDIMAVITARAVATTAATTVMGIEIIEAVIATTKA